MGNPIYLTILTVLILAVAKVSADFSCDFETNCTHWDFSKHWKIEKASQRSRPNIDHTYGSISGHYRIARPSKKGDVATVIGQVLIFPADTSCLIFSTYFEGDVTLRVYAQNVFFGSTLLDTIALADSKKMNKWETVKLPMNGLTTLQKIKITVTFANRDGFFAIDDLSFSETTCDKSNVPDGKSGGILDILKHVRDYIFGSEKTSTPQVKSTTKTLPLKTTSTPKLKITTKPTTVEDTKKLKTTEVTTEKRGTTVKNVPTTVTTQDTTTKKETTINTKNTEANVNTEPATKDKETSTEKITTEEHKVTERETTAEETTTKKPSSIKVTTEKDVITNNVTTEKVPSMENTTKAEVITSKTTNRRVTTTSDGTTKEETKSPTEKTESSTFQPNSSPGIHQTTSKTKQSSTFTESSSKTADRQNSSTVDSSIQFSESTTSTSVLSSTERHQQSTNKTATDDGEMDPSVDNTPGLEYKYWYMISATLVLAMIGLSVLSMHFYQKYSTNSSEIHLDMEASDNYTFDQNDKQQLTTADHSASAHA